MDYKRTTTMQGALLSLEITTILLGYVAMDMHDYQRKIEKLDGE